MAGVDISQLQVVAVMGPAVNTAVVFGQEIGTILSPIPGTTHYMTIVALQIVLSPQNVNLRLGGRLQIAKLVLTLDLKDVALSVIAAMATRRGGRYVNT